MPVPALDVNFFDRSVVEDPFPLYEQIRSAGRIVWNDTLKGWMIPGFEECSTVLTDSGERFAIMNGDPNLIFWFDAPNMIQVDGAEHQRLRRCLVPLFTRSATAKWEQRVGEVVDELLTPLRYGSDNFDLIADFTMIPTVIVAEMLGVPKERHHDFRRWSHEIVSNLAYGHEDPVARAVMKGAADGVNSYLTEEIERHRREQPDDLITAMLGMSEMSDAEVRSAAILLFIAGYDTTAKLMGMSLVALELHPDQRRMLADDLSLVPDGIEEVLRWTGVSQMTPRLVLRDTELAGTKLPAGDVVHVLMAAANRDPNRWSDPQRFDVRRDPKSNLGFGFGPHLCLGAPLARLETKVAIERLLKIAPEYQLRDIDLGDAFYVRGPERGLIDVGAPTAA
jgi:cytochrome P450